VTFYISALEILLLTYLLTLPLCCHGEPGTLLWQNFLPARCSFGHTANSVKAMKGKMIELAAIVYNDDVDDGGGEYEILSVF